MPLSKDDSGALMLYDGLCGFCNASVRWVLKHDRGDRFRFAAQQSELAKQILSRHGVSPGDVIRSNSVYLILHPGSAQEELLLRSDVTVAVLKMLGAPWGFLGRLLDMIPHPLRDAAYTLVANNRYRIGRRLDRCPIPSLQERSKFVGFES